MNNNEMLEIVKCQLAIDYNCNVEDFFKDGITFTEAVKQEGRRKLPFVKPRCEMITMGNGVVINASKDIMPFVKKRLKNKNKLEILNAQFVSNFNLYHLPDLENRTPVVLNPDFEYKIVEQAEIHDYYKYKGLTNALHYDKNCVTPETLAVAVFDGDKLLGIAAAKADCETMCQIGVDVYPEYRNKGLASSMVALLTDELLNRGYIPYYFLYCGNIASERTALAAGYFPVWLHCYKTRLFGKPFTWLNYLRFSQ